MGGRYSVARRLVLLWLLSMVDRFLCLIHIYDGSCSERATYGDAFDVLDVMDDDVLRRHG